MKQFVDLELHDQAAIVLLCLLEDISTEKRTLAGVEHHVFRLWDIVSEYYNIPDQEVEAVVQAVAKMGVEMLPGYDTFGAKNATGS